MRELLSELRSHPERNPHIGVEEALRPYRYDPDVYVSFTDDVGKNSHLFTNYGSPDEERRSGARPGGARNGSGAKVGINPRTQYLETPAAVYAYPLSSMWDAIVSKGVPWGRDRPYIQVLRARGPVLDLGSYGDSDLAQDMAKLKPVLLRIAKAKGKTWAELSRFWRRDIRKGASAAVKFWEILKHASNSLSAIHNDIVGGEDTDQSGGLQDKAGSRRPAIWNGLLRSLGYTAVVDHGAMVIHGNEPHQIAFLSPKSYEVVATVKNVNKDAQMRLPIPLPTHPVKEHSLNEATWSDRSPLIQDLAKSKGRWIHFSAVPKIGVNPQSAWTMTGPYGVYLYPVDFLLAGNERIEDGQQFGTDMPYYFLCDLDLSMPGLNLSKMTDADADRIALANGFGDALTAFRGSLIPGQSSGVTFWKFLRKMNDRKEMSWNRALRGLAYVIDETGVMYGHLEPKQAVVLNPRALSHISQHDNTRSGFREINSDNARTRHGAWKRVYTDVLNGLKTRFGGAVRWQESPDLVPHTEYRDKAKIRRRAPAMPTLTFESHGRRIEVTPIQSTMNHGFRLSFQYGRESDTRTVSADEMRKLSTTQIVEKLAGFIDEIIGFESDLRFTPFLPEDEAEPMIEEGIGRRGTPFEIETEVANDTTGGVVIYRAEREAEQGDVTVKTIVRLNVGPDGFSGSARIDLMGKGFVDVGQYGEDYTDRDAMMEDLARQFVEKLDMYERLYGPQNDRRAPFIFKDDAQWQAFKGWLVFRSGLYFDGNLYGLLADAAMAYNDYEDPDGLSWRIASIFKHGF